MRLSGKMLFKKMLRTIGEYKAQFISMIIMLSIGIGIFIGSNMEWLSVQKESNAFYQKTEFADYRLLNRQGFSKNDLEKVLSIEGVQKATRFFSADMAVHEKNNLLSVCINENFSVSTFMLIEGEPYNSNDSEGLWLSDKYAQANDLHVGDSLVLSYQDFLLEVVIKGLVKSSEYLVCVLDDTQVMPDYLRFGFAFLSTASILPKIGFEYYPQIHIQSDLSFETIEKELFARFDKNVLAIPKKDVPSYSGVQGEIEEGKIMGSVYPILFLLISLLTMVTTMHRLTKKEKVQIGILKALGFRNRKIIWHYISFGLWVGFLASLLGLGLGFFICYLILNPKGAMATYMDLPSWRLYVPWFCWILLAAILFGLALISLLSIKKVMAGTPAQTLRPYTPKKIKTLLIEKTRFWSKADFGVRWNLRDIFRYKSRSLMSLVGVCGCVAILIASFGINDTVNELNDLYYNRIVNYKVKINLSNELGNEEAISLAKKYDGVFYASTPMKLEKEVIPFEIFATPNDKFRFVDEKNSLIPLPKEGVLIPQAIAKSYKIKVGDSIDLVDYFGTYKLSVKVAGFSRMMSKAIVTSEEYAQNLQFPYKINAIYSNFEKEEVETSQAIANIQTKEDLIGFMDTFMTLMDIFLVIFIVAAIVLAVVVLYNLGIMGYAERYRELATLKIVGFKDKKIGQLLVIQNLWITAVGILIGIPFGIFALNELFSKMSSFYAAKVVLLVPSYLYTILLTLVVSILVSLLVARKNKQIDMVEALKIGE